MKAAIALTFVLSLGCVTASPTFGAIAASKSSSLSASSSSYSSSSSFGSINYYSADVCTAVGFNIREDLSTCIFDELEQQFLQKKCELLNSYGVYPRDIGPLFCDLQPDSLYYDIILVGSGPAGLSSLQSLAALGKRVLLIDRGDFAPACADSLYYRNSLYSNSQYVTSYPGYINGVDITKNLYSYNILGGCSVMDSNTWNIGSKCLYDQLAQINDQWSWEKIYGYYKGLECYKSYSRSVSVSTSSSSSSSSSSAAYGSSVSGSSYSSSSQQTTTSTTTTYEYSTSGLYSIYNSFEESYLTRTLSSVFDELGYCNSPSPFDLLPNKYCILPVLGDIDRPTLFPHTVFNALEQYKSNIDLALRTTANQILFESDRASGILVTTPSGQQVTVYARDQVILSTGPISTYQLLFNSGCGPQDLLNKYNIPVNFHIPYLGNGLVLPPVHHGICLKFPKGYLNDCDSDLRNLAYAFGDYKISSSLSLNYYRAYLAVKGAQEANIALKFYAFSQSTSIRLRSMMQSYFQYDSYTQEYISSLINEYDILIVGTHLLTPKSRGLISYKDCIDQPYIDLGLYSDNYDLECMLEAIEQIRSLAQTKTFLNLNCEVVQFPIQNCQGDFFTAEYNRQSILYHSIPSQYASGGYPIGLDYQTAVVDKALRFVGTKNLRYFHPCVSPYPLSADSLAFSTFIGQYGAEVIANEYNGIYLDSISIAAASSAISSSYSSRDISASSSYSSTDIDINSSSGCIDNGLGIGNGLGIDSTSISSSSNSYDYDAQQCSSNSIVGGNGIVSQQSSSSSSVDIDQSSSSSSYLGGNGLVNQQSSSSSSSVDIDQSSSSSSYLGGNGLVSQQSSSSSSSVDIDQSSSSSSYLGGNGLVSQQSSSSSYDASQASNVSSSSYSSGLGGVAASSYEASSQSSVSAQQESSSYVSGIGC